MLNFFNTPEKLQHLSHLEGLLHSPKRIVITMHQGPDADALGSSLALMQFLEKHNHKVTVVCPNEYPKFLSWMKGSQKVLIYENGQQKLVQKYCHEADLIFCIDFSSLNRVQGLAHAIIQSKATRIMIDHHTEPEDFDHLRFWDTSSSSTAEIVYHVFKGLKATEKIDSAIAECLYAGLMTDTGLFQNPNTTTGSHYVTIKLMEHGADVSKVAREIYNKNSLNRLKFLGFALTERLTVLSDQKTAYFTISKADTTRFALEVGDTEGLVNYGLTLKGIQVSALIIEKENNIRLSLRSVGELAVSSIAKHYFNGGGHKNAAGGVSSLSLLKTAKNFEQIIKENPAILTSTE